MADEKLTQLPEVVTPTNDDYLYLVDDPAGTPISKKISYANLAAAIGAGGGEANVGANVGAGDGVYEGKVGTTLRFKSLTASGGLALVASGTEIDIDGSAIPGEALWLADVNQVLVVSNGGERGTYATLAAAVAAASAGDTIIVLNDVTEVATISVANLSILVPDEVTVSYNTASDCITVSSGTVIIGGGGRVVNYGAGYVLNVGAGCRVKAQFTGDVFVQNSASFEVMAGCKFSDTLWLQSANNPTVTIHSSNMNALTVAGASAAFNTVSAFIGSTFTGVSSTGGTITNAPFYSCELGPSAPTNVTVKAGNYSNTVNGVTWPAPAASDTNIASASNILVVDPSGGIQNSYATVEAADAVAVDGDTILILGDIEITSIIPASAKSITIWIAPGVTVSTDDGISRFLSYGGETLKIVNQGVINTPYYASRSIVYSVQGGNNSRLEIYGGNITSDFPNGIPIGVGNTVELFLYNVAAISQDADGAGYAIGSVSGPGTAVLAANHGIFNCHLEIQGVTGSQETIDVSTTAINIHGSALYGGSAPFGTSAPAQGNHSNTFEGETWRQGVYVSQVDITAASGAAKTIDLDVTDVWRVTLSADCTFTFSNPPTAGKAGSFTIELIQDGTGSWTPTWPAAVIWPSGAAPTLNTAAGTKHLVSFMTTDGGTTWYGTAITDFS